MELKSFLHDQFQTKDLGRLTYLLGIEVAYSAQGIYISQRKYVLDILEETGLMGWEQSQWTHLWIIVSSLWSEKGSYLKADSSTTEEEKKAFLC